MKYLLIFLLLSHSALADFNPELSQIIDYEVNQIQENLVETRILDEDRNILTSFEILSNLAFGVQFPFVVSLTVVPILYLKWSRPTNQSATIDIY